jgi:hypothetical protein
MQKNSEFVVGVRDAPFSRLLDMVMDDQAISMRKARSFRGTLRDVNESKCHDTFVNARRLCQNEGMKELQARHIQSAVYQDFSPNAPGLLSEVFDEYVKARSALGLGPLAITTQDSELTALYGPSKSPAAEEEKKLDKKRKAQTTTSAAKKAKSEEAADSSSSDSKTSAEPTSTSHTDASLESGEASSSDDSESGDGVDISSSSDTGATGVSSGVQGVQENSVESSSIGEAEEAEPEATEEEASEAEDEEEIPDI